MLNKENAIKAVTRATRISTSEMLSESREWPCVEARMLLVYLLSQEGMTDEAISWVINRKRVAVLKARHNAVEQLEVSRQFTEKWNQVKSLYDEYQSVRVS